MSQPEESREKTSKTDDILLKPVLKDLDDLKKHQGRDRPKKRPHAAGERDRSDKDT